MNAVEAAAAEYGVRGIPTVVFFQSGEEVHRITGLRTQESYEEIRNRLIKKS